MPKFCANLTWLFTEMPFLERFAAAKDAGFDAVEVLFPYDVNAQDIVHALSRCGLKMALINCPPPNYTGGDPGNAAVPGAQERFRHDFMRALRYAKTLGAQHLHVMAGAAEGDVARSVFVDNLRWAAAEAPKQSLTIEPIDAVSMPGYFLDDFGLARDVITAVGAPNLHLQFDAFHAARITGDVIGTWAAMRDLVVHVQVAQTPHRDEPDRDEPDRGQIDYPAFFAALDAQGYAGWVSGEYKPRADTVAGLGWLRTARALTDDAA
ncbi:TIM barrel protein [Yoonia sp.]|uniref:hydroxypyruvate isomerase family protein n=1 Tax=Yoonia sp. TaxID=2212373 RepID=UPI0025F0D7B6|nr:TIM barrel protein [Yoonia sp.]